MLKAALVAFASLLPVTASAAVVTIAASPASQYGTTVGWHGVGQSLIVPDAVDVFDAFALDFSSGSAGQTFWFSVDGDSGTLFSTTFKAVAGTNVISVGTTVEALSNLLVSITFGTFNADSALFSDDAYSGGYARWLQSPLGKWTHHPTLDLKFSATFSRATSEVPAPVPVPASLPMLLLGLVGLGWIRRRSVG